MTIGDEAFEAVREWERSYAAATGQLGVQTDAYDTMRYNEERAHLLIGLAQIEQLKRIADWLDGAGCDHES